MKNEIAKTAAGKDIQEMMTAWTKIEAAIAINFPGATEEKKYQLCKEAMKAALSL
jgi:hypothetical protein